MPVVDQNPPIFPEPDPDPATGLIYDPTRGYMRDPYAPMDAGYVGPSELDPMDNSHRRYQNAPAPAGGGGPTDSIDPASIEIVKSEPAAAPAPAATDNIDPDKIEIVKPDEEPAWLRAAEWTVPPALMYGGEAGGALAGGMAAAGSEGVGAPLVPILATAGAGAGNAISDVILDQMRRLAGVKREDINPAISIATGMGGSILGRAATAAPGVVLKGLAGGPSAEAVEEAGEKGAEATLNKINPITGETQPGPLRKAASNLTEEVGGAGARESLGIPATTAGINTGLTEQTALEHVGAQDSALQPVGRLFEKKGKAIGDLLNPFKDLDANTTALGDAAHMTAEGEFGGTIGETVKKNGMKVSPGVQKLFQDASAIGDQGTDKIGSILGRLNTIQEMLGKRSLGAGDRYVLSELRDQYLDIAADSQNIPSSVQQALKGPRAEYRTLKDYYKGFYGVGGTTSPAETGEFLWKQQPRALTTMLNEATPEETDHLANATGQYLTGDGRNTGAETVKRFNELKAKNPEALKKMFGEGPFSQASTWADLPKMQDAFIQGIRDPQLQGGYVQGWRQGVLNTPEAQALAQAREHFMSLPKPEQARLAAKMAEIEKPEGARNIIGGQRFFLARMVLFAPMGIGIAAHHPEVAMGLGAIYGVHMGMAAAIRNNPEMYLAMLRSANSKTVQGLYRAGYYASRIAMMDSAAFLERQIAGADDADMPIPQAQPGAEPTP